MIIISASKSEEHGRAFGINPPFGAGPDVNNGGLERWQNIENSAEHQAREKHY